MGNDNADELGSGLSLPIEDASGEGVSELIAKLKPGYALCRFRGGDADGLELVWSLNDAGLPPERIKVPDIKGLKAVHGVQPRPWIRSLVYRRASAMTSFGTTGR